MPRGDQGSPMLAGNIRFVKTNPFITRQDRITPAYEAVSIAQNGRHAPDLKASLFPLAHDTARQRKGLFEKGLDVPRLQAMGFRALHLFPERGNRGGIEAFLGEL